MATITRWADGANAVQIGSETEWSNHTYLNGTNQTTNFATAATARNTYWGDDWRGLDFSAIYDDSTITGIAVYAYTKETGTANCRYRGQFYDGTTAIGTLYDSGAVAGSTSPVRRTVSPTGTLPTVAQLKSATFGYRFEATRTSTTANTESVAYIEVVVTYTPIAAGAASPLAVSASIAAAGDVTRVGSASLPVTAAIAAAGPVDPLTVVQVKGPVQVQSLTGPLSLTLDTATGSQGQSTLVACITTSGSIACPVPSSMTLGGAADHWQAAYEDPATPLGAFFWTDRDCASGQTGVELTCAGGSGVNGDIYLTVYEVTGLLSYDQGSHNEVASGASTWTSNTSPETAQAPEIYFGACTCTGQIPAATGVGTWETVSTGTGQYDQTAGWQQAAVTGTATFSGTVSVASGYVAAVATFYAGAGVKAGSATAPVTATAAAEGQVTTGSGATLAASATLAAGGAVSGGQGTQALTATATLAAAGAVSTDLGASPLGVTAALAAAGATGQIPYLVRSVGFTSGAAFSLTASTAAGDAIAVLTDAATNQSSVTDTQGNTYVHAEQDTHGNDLFIASYHGSPGTPTLALVAGTDTITVTGDSGAAIVAAIPGAAAAVADKTPAPVREITSTPSGPATGVLSQAEEIILYGLCGVTALASQITSWGGGFTQISTQAGGGGGEGLAWLRTTVTDSVTPSATLSASQAVNSFAVTLRLAGGAVAGDAALPATATLAADGYVTMGGGATLAASAALTATGDAPPAAGTYGAGLYGAGVYAGTPVWEGQAPLAVTATLAAGGQAVAQDQAQALTVTAALAAAGLGEHLGQASAMVATATRAATGNVGAAVNPLAASAALTAAGQATHLAGASAVTVTAALAADGGTGGSASRPVTATAAAGGAAERGGGSQALAATATVAAAGAVIRIAGASLAMSASLAAGGQDIGGQGATAMTVTAACSAAGEAGTLASPLTVTAALTAGGLVVRAAEAAPLTVTAAVAVGRTAAYAGQGSLVASATIAALATGTMQGQAAVAVAATLQALAIAGSPIPVLAHLAAGVAHGQWTVGAAHDGQWAAGAAHDEWGVGAAHT